MTPEEIKKELQDKIGEFQRQSRLISLEVINWLEDLIKRIENHIVEDNKKVEKEIKVEVKEEEKPIKSRGKGKWK